MSIHTLTLGVCDTNCYLVMNDETKALVIIDPAADAAAIIGKIEELSGKPEAILLTHGHFDHVLAAGDLKERYGIPIIGGIHERLIFEDPKNNLTAANGEPLVIHPDRFVSQDEKITAADYEFTCLETNGHTAGSIGYYLAEQKVLFSGDTLMQGTVGRTDLPTGNTFSLIASIRGKFYRLPEETIVCPGHGGPTTIGHEKKYNPYVRTKL